MGTEIITNNIDKMTTLTDVMEIFVDKLKVLPQNLENHALKLLMILTIIDITYQVFEVENIDWSKWIVKKVMRVGLLIWIIKEWNWLLKEIAIGFIKIGELGFGGNIENCKYVDNPSKLISKANEIGNTILESTSMISPRTWANLILWAFLMVGFFFIAFSIIIIWIEFYMLTGIGIMFIPFGTLKVGENYFSSVCKLVVGCGIKLCVLNAMILLIEPIIEKLAITKDGGTNGFCFLITVIMILAYMTLKIPDMAASMLSGTPGMNASAAIGTGMAAIGMSLTSIKTAINTIDVGKGGAKGIKKGAETGGNIGGKVGSSIGGIFGAGGAAVGGKIGSAIGGTVGAGLYGTYSAAKLGKNFERNNQGGNSQTNKATEKASKAAKKQTDTGTSTSPNSNTQNDTGTSASPNNNTQNDTGTSASPNLESVTNTDTGNTSNNNIQNDSGNEGNSNKSTGD